ncbi:galactokinase [Streptomyces sp. NPDC047014]|uniref:galactokinase n=1 Tax=Streptomyces sp. NPDC047014 TaxID=3155736 RepID=UPI0033E8CF0A
MNDLVDTEGAADAVRREFERVHGRAPEGVWAAPGRVNLIGEHTDYNDGFCLPMALPRTTVLAAGRRDDGLLRLHSTRGGEGRITELRVAELAPGGVTGWARYPAGVVWALRERGLPVGGADVHLDSTVPVGAGLSSSAALECAVAVAYDELYGLRLDRPETARVAQYAENAFAGVPCGVMDQMASMCCTEGNALHLDSRTLEVRQVPFDLTGHGLRLLVLDTGVSHDLADGAYAALRAGCERAAGLLGVAALRDLGGADLPAALAGLPPELAPLVRHVVTENERVGQAVDRLAAGAPEALGALLTAGHASLRDDYRVSCAETDLAVAAAVGAGALGARMTGGGFGGSVIALVREDAAEGVARAVAGAFASAGFKPPSVLEAVPSAGARRTA